MKIQPGSAVLAATAAIALAAVSVPPATAAPGGNPNNPKKFTKAVTAEAVMGHLEQFQAIADANGGNRAAGTSGYEESARYVERTLQAAGYQTWRQPFSFTYTETTTSLEEVSPTARSIDQRPMSYGPDTPVGGITGELVQPATVTGCDASEWGDTDATGKIALVSRGACSFSQKSLAAGEAGASALIIYNNEPGMLNGTLSAPNEGYVPTTGITQDDGQALAAEAAAGPVVVTFNLQSLVEERETFNVLAETTTGRDDNVVMIGSHLDGAQEGPGMSDNGSGAAANLETAVQMAKVNKVNNKIRFAFWGAEERGLVGARHYVNDLVENDPQALGDIALYLNYDMVGSPNYIIGVYDADQSTYPAPVPVPEGSAAVEKVFTDYYDSVDQPWVDTEFSGRSDYQPFIDNGVPSSGLFTGADGVKTPEEVELFGGTAGLLYDPNYHTAADDIDNINPEAIAINTKAMAHAAIVFAYDTSMVNGETSPGKSGKIKPGNQGKAKKVGAQAAPHLAAS
ncbi:M20/M25/M40 family metallo-hydrolase [Naumannella cuiyingiana]|uniref:Zn-dependent M28 family amino/carboxypeptidase n=1 Tax=Naumannella cuiyingiana TaxID=1347891 RepID=A0A7Z0IM72_9ACTN|nr:M20/M25/M40 family metallo-hydrolase [Naumannella cuiyingiana]NYI72439.1 Zn-dependent M28 family amino/carboxypeptidase [Naumannella cuiyingiana]